MAAFWRNFARSNSRRVFSLSRSSFNRSASFSCTRTVCPGPRLRTLVRNQRQLLITSQNVLVEIISQKWGLNNLTSERVDVSTPRFPLFLFSLCLFPFLPCLFLLPEVSCNFQRKYTTTKGLSRIVIPPSHATK